MNPIKNILIGLAYLTVIFSLVGAVIFNQFSYARGADENQQKKG